MGDREKDRPDEGPGFKVIDRRGQAGAETAAKPAESAAPSPEPHDEAPLGVDASLGPIDFMTFILSLGSSAALHLGDLPDPEAGARRPSLAEAQQIIDLLGMLREKTRGNLTPEESRFLDGLLYDLRLRFVSARGPAAR